ncbi:MAG: hypothetical protein OXN16_00925 [Gammaproteobacteria bacterium]|nr:hypothetical protein [Gammaproteobacteria bacterium]
MRIDLYWEGPHSFEEALEMTEDRDKGFYQIYILHPVYGNDTLVYIGRTNKAFGHRLDDPAHKWMGDHRENNSGRIRIHTGRIVRHEENPISAPNALMEYAESLLIFAHGPSWNGDHVKNRPRVPKDVDPDVRVLNWGQYGLLLPEVSNARWSVRARDFLPAKTGP